MDAGLVGLMTASTVTFGTIFWYLLVRPQVLLSFLDQNAVTDAAWVEPDAPTLRALRWASGATLFLLGFLTGLITAFLSST